MRYTTTIDHIMTRRPETVTPLDSLHLVGILSTHDLVKVLEKVLGSDIDYAG